VRVSSLTAREAAALLGVRTSTIYAYASRGLLGGGTRGPGRQALYPRELVENLRVKAASRAGHTAVAAAALRWGEPVLDSAITRITPRGPVYRGTRATDLVEQPFEDVTELLWAHQADWTQRLPRVRTRSPRPSLHTLLEVVVHFAPKLAVEDLHHAPALIHRLACAAGEGEALAESQPTIAGALTTSLLNRRAKPHEVVLVNAALVLIADHELNASTFAARVAASAQAPWVDCIIAALGAAAGTRHAAACDATETLWRTAKRARNTSQWVAQQLDLNGALPGFEVGAYRDGDPRAELLLRRLRPTLGSVGDRLDELLTAVERKTGQMPAVDLAFAVLSSHFGFPQGAAKLLFVLGRTAGWLAHVAEQRSSVAAIRPRARYVGASAS
jgi:citrate synthase